MTIARFLILVLCFACSENLPALELEKIFMPGELISGHRKFESECTLCHVRMRDTTQPMLCRDCHKKIDEDMREKRGYHGKDKNAHQLECKTCHADHKGRNARIVWLDSDRFDHRITDFPLAGKHALTECSACHQTGTKYRDAKTRCSDCHAKDDAHNGELGANCGQCHVASGWRKSEFDHDRTKFKLRESHRRVSCEGCHSDGRYQNTPTRCASCHAIRDVHANRFGSNCARCHREKEWKLTVFDHGRDARYPLAGKHRGANCNACHGIDYQKSRKSGAIRVCYQCHREDDVHAGSNGRKCQDCHRDTGWQNSSFDHDARTRFALTGSHKNLACAACHEPGAGSNKIDTACYSCHRSDDAHQKKLGTACDRCHNDTAWQTRVRFDHDLSDFPLIGQHAVLGCESCHLDSVFTGTGDRCVDCHRADDVHGQAFGRDCANCHNPNAWLIWRFDHDKTDFPLRYSHGEIHCQGCHDRPLTQIASKVRKCIDCHRRDDIHHGDFGGRCDKCHNEKSFKNPEIQSLKTFVWRVARLGRITP